MRVSGANVCQREQAARDTRVGTQPGDRSFFRLCPLPSVWGSRSWDGGVLEPELHLDEVLDSGGALDAQPERSAVAGLFELEGEEGAAEPLERDPLGRRRERLGRKAEAVAVGELLLLLD